MGQDAADALDLREAQVLADPDGQGVEAPQDQPGGDGEAQQASRGVLSAQSPLSTQVRAGLQQGRAQPQPGLLRDGAVVPRAGEPHLSSRTSMVSRLYLW